jgi:hypothetical protein
MFSLGISHSRSERIQGALRAAICSLVLVVPSGAWNQAGSPNQKTVNLQPATATQNSTSIGHSADIRTGPSIKTGPTVSPGMSGGQKAGMIGGIAAAAILIAVTVHHYQHKLPSAEDLLRKGPRVPENASMSHLIVDGLIGPGWPVGLDFQLEGPGSLTLDITTAGNVHYHQELTNHLNGRGITITYPPDLDKLQPATFDVEAKAPDGSNNRPSVRIYGMAAGPHAVGSIAIDQLVFGPTEVKINQAAQYGFHSHSDFSNVCADFMYTGVKDNQIVIKQDNETPLSPVSRDERAKGSLPTKGTVGRHLLQIRAWRGNSGDWVVAWSPDVVTMTK